MTARIAIALLALTVGVGEARGEGDLRQRARVMKKALSPVLAFDSAAVAHVWWDGIQIRDRLGNAWAGTAPQIAKSGAVPAGAGPFGTTAGNYYTLGAGSDPLDLATFTAVIVFRPNSVPAIGYLFSNFVSNVSGYALYIQTGGSLALRTYGAGGGSSASGSTNPTVGEVSVVCFGLDGAGASKLKVNLGTFVTGVDRAVLGTGATAFLGNGNGANAFPGAIYEIQFIAAAPTDALCTAKANEVKAKGITTW